MGVADLDYCELHLSFKDYFTSLPYVDPSTGYTTLDMPYESITFTDTMYLPTQHTLSQATIVMPSLLDRPDLRYLLQQVKETTRVELYLFQPDCGDPIFAGYILPGGITEQSGNATIVVEEPLTQGNWGHIRPIEVFDVPMIQLIERGMQRWTDVVNDTFQVGLVDETKYFANDGQYSNWDFGGGWNPLGLVVPGNGIEPVGGLVGGSGVPIPPYRPAALSAIANNRGYVALYATQVAQPLYQSFNNLTEQSPIYVSGPMSIMLEVDYDSNFVANYPVSASYLTQWAAGLNLSNSPSSAFGTAMNGMYLFAEILQGANELGSNVPYVYGANFQAQMPDTGFFAVGGQSSTTTQPAWDMNEWHHLTMLVNINETGVICYLYKDNLYAGSMTVTTESVIGQTLYAGLYALLSDIVLTSWVAFTNFRVRTLDYYIQPSENFSAQVPDPTYYQPNNESGLDFLDLWLQGDGSECRTNFRAAPNPDTLDVAPVGLLGKYVSNVRGYDAQPYPLPTSPFISMTGKDDAEMLMGENSSVGGMDPPLRIEEGWNLTDAPQRMQASIPYANEIVRLGANDSNAQVFGDAYSTADVGNPASSNYPRTHPYVEAITNDDRVDLYNVLSDLAAIDLDMALDQTPALQVTMLAPLEFMGKYRGGDTILTKTQSLINNIDEPLRIMQVINTAGSPEKQIVLGTLIQDASMDRRIAKDTVQGWAYQQTGAGLSTFVYPTPGSISAYSNSTSFDLYFDQFSSGTAIVGAFMHWFTVSAPVGGIFAVVNGAQVPPTNSTGTDSGVVDVTGLFRGGPGNYTFAFFNNTGSAVALENAFINVQIRM